MSALSGMAWAMSKIMMSSLLVGMTSLYMDELEQGRLGLKNLGSFPPVVLASHTMIAPAHPNGPASRSAGPVPAPH